MIYPYTLFLHLVMAGLSSLILAHFVYTKKSFSNVALRAYFNWFLLFFLYNISLVAPLLFFNKLGLATGTFYSFALIFLALGMWQAVKVALAFLVSREKVIRILSTIFLIGVLAAALLHFIFPEIPRGSENGNWVFWYSGREVSLLYIAFSFFAGWLFSFSFLRNIRQVPELVLKIRAFLLTLPGFIMPFAAFYYFGAQEIAHIYLAFFFSILGLLFFVVGNILIRLSKQGNGQG